MSRTPILSAILAAALTLPSLAADVPRLLVGGPEGCAYFADHTGDNFPDVGEHHMFVIGAYAPWYRVLIRCENLASNIFGGDLMLDDGNGFERRKPVRRTAK